jgi:LDH2 family malate/lactate/ureidoglycolate dehydrogenase
MLLPQAEARELAVRILVRHRMPRPHAEVVAGHLVDAMLAGHSFAGLPCLSALALTR